MTIVAEREFMIIEGAELRPARVLVYAPEKISDNEWKCEYRLVGFSKDRARKAYGVDSYQALYLALKILATEIAITDEYKGGKLTLFGKADFDINEMMGFLPA